MAKKRMPNKIAATGKKTAHFMLNKIPAMSLSWGYNAFSKVHKGQISKGLPVSKKLKKRHEEVRNRAVGKLALSLYHIFFPYTKDCAISRNKIKNVLFEELDRDRIRITENVILLTEEQLEYFVKERFRIPTIYFPYVLSAARRRWIIKEKLIAHRTPAYFESEIEEKDENGRGDYETVYFRDFTDAGKAIEFRRLVSIEKVTAGDNQPSVVLVPGLACNSNFYNLDNRYSLAKDMADLGHWVYLFDPRGLGINKGKFDHLLTIDSMIDYDLATVTRFISRRSKGKPMILVGHSMGGIISELMVLNWNLRRRFNDLVMLTSEQRELLDKVLPPLEEAEENLSMIRAVITLGSPKFFDKTSHIAFSLFLWLNHLSRLLRLSNFPLDKPLQFVTDTPGIRFGARTVLNRDLAGLNFLIVPQNFRNDKDFILRLLKDCGETIPLGMGFQFLKAIYNGEGFKRMDETGLNYSEMLSFFPEDIPLFHFWGNNDPLAPPSNLQYSQSYQHQEKKLYHISSEKDLRYIEVSQQRNQMVNFVVDGVNHIDLLYGERAKKVIHPLLFYIIQQAWSDWRYVNATKAA